MIEIYAVALAAVVLAQIAPGPNLLAVAGVALAEGRNAALMVALGVATAIFSWVTMAALGLGAVLSLYPMLLTGLKLLGGGYLCFLAIKALYGVWRGAAAPGALKGPATSLSPMAAWRRGLLVNLTNPKSGLMWGAVTSYMFGSGLSGAQVLGFAPIGFLSALTIYGLYGALFSSGLARRAHGRAARWIERMFGLAFGALGGALLSEGVRDIGR